MSQLRQSAALPKCRWRSHQRHFARADATSTASKIPADGGAGGRYAQNVGKMQLTPRKERPAEARRHRGKLPFDIPEMMRRVREAVRHYPKAVLFELAERGFGSPFQILVACIITIRTLEEVSLPAALKLICPGQHARSSRRFGRGRDRSPHRHLHFPSSQVALDLPDCQAGC